MLTQERFEEIVRIVTRDGAATVPQGAWRCDCRARGGACAGAQYAGKIQS